MKEIRKAMPRMFPRQKLQEFRELSTAIKALAEENDALAGRVDALEKELKDASQP